MSEAKPFTLLEAIREGIREEMSRDESVFVIGEDVGTYGGAFKVTEGLLDQFGSGRVIDTPISEAAIVGAACGAALIVITSYSIHYTKLYDKPALCFAAAHRIILAMAKSIFTMLAAAMLLAGGIAALV